MELNDWLAIIGAFGGLEELELQLKDAEHNRCDRPDSECGRRIPPRRATLIKDKEEKK